MSRTRARRSTRPLASAGFSASAPRAAPVAVLALGGNALAPSEAESDIHAQFRHTRQSLGIVVELARAGWNLCIVHGNGPQVGAELMRHEVARPYEQALPLGVLVAATAGWIGYMIQQSLDNALRRARLERPATTVITQVVVSRDDPALRQPTKFVGHELTAELARGIEGRGGVVRLDGRGRLRQVVGSPRPLAVRELPVIRRLVEQGTIVVACGGGGTPIHDDPQLGWEGIDAVIDKDLAAAVLARDLGARLLLILTDVDAVYADWGTPAQRALRRLSVEEAERLDALGAFGEGSMRPKVRAAVEFVRRTGGRAVITDLTRGGEAIRGRAGTTIAVDGPRPSHRAIGAP